MPVSQQSGFTFPMIQQGDQGRVNYTRNNSPRLIQDSVLQILLTSPGERLWNPTFGCRIRKVQFDPASPAYTGLIQNLILEALNRWEPRITVKASDITVSFDEQGNTNINVSYTINNPDFTGSAKGSVTVQL
jgi:phage baseplate assembly protein W